MPDHAAEPRVHSPWKRSACDRCRSQKLRCLRQEDDTTASAPCLRCIRCRTPCFTSSAKPLGRPCKSAVRARHQRSQSASGEPPRERPTPRSHAHTMPSTQSPLTTLPMPSVDSYTPPADEVGLYDYFIDPMLPAGLYDASTTLPMAMPMEPALQFSPDDMVFAPSEADSADASVLLAGLHQNLSRQLSLVRTVPWDASVLASSGPSSLKADGGDSERFNPLAAVVSATADFLEVARIFRDPDQDMLTSLNGDGLTHKVDSRIPPSPSLSLSSSYQSPLLPHALFPAHTIPNLLSPPGSSESAGTQTQDPSTAQLLTILSCYLQAVAVYDAILVRMLMSLTRMHDAGLLGGGPPDLFFPDYTLSAQRRLLMRLVLQVVEHEFGVIERALGLPHEFCVSAGGLLDVGLLSGHEARALLETIVGLNFDGGDGRGGLQAVASLRENMKRVQQMI